MLFLAAYVNLSYCCAGRGRGGITARELYDQTVGWHEAVRRAGISPFQAVFQALFWLVFFHWLQPLAYFAALYSVWDELDTAQHLLGGAVAVREALYFIAAGVAAILRPEYLLVSLTATIAQHGPKMGGYHLIVYVMAPEKAVGMTLAFGSKEGRLRVVKGILVLDAFALVALLAAVSAGITPLPLMLGYVFTIVGGLGAVGVLVTEAGLRDLKQQGWRMGEVKKTKQYSLLEVREAGYTCEDARVAGYTCGEAKVAGYSLPEMHLVAGYSGSEAKAAGYSYSEAKAAGYSSKEMKVGGYSCSEAKAAGYSLKEMQAAGYSCSEAKAAGYSCSEAKAAGYSLEEMKAVGYSCSEAKAAGYSLKEMKAAGYDARAAEAASYASCSEAKKARYKLKEIKQAGYSCAEAKQAGYSLREMQAEGFVEGLKEAGFSCSEAKGAGYSMEDVKRAGFSWEEAHAAGYPAASPSARASS